MNLSHRNESTMEQKSRKEILTEEINLLTKLIEEARKNKKRTLDKYRKQLTNLILELDALGKDSEIDSD